MVDSFGHFNSQIRTEILPNLWLGDADDADYFVKLPRATVFSVHEDHNSVPDKAVHLPILDNPTAVYINRDVEVWVNKPNLDLVCRLVDEALTSGRPVLVHCWQGIERSPLTVAYYLARYHRERFPTFQSAYDHVKALRPIVQERTHWLTTACRREVGLYTPPTDPVET